MALVQCPECGRDVSTQAAACPGCGAPITSIQAAHPVSPPRSGTKLSTVLLLVAIIVVVAWLFMPSKRDPAEGVDYITRRPPAPAKPVIDEQVKAAAIARFNGIVPEVRHVEWMNDGDFLIAARENGSSWQPVADAACAWIRSQGAPAGFSVIVLEASALQNKRWDQLARARCN